MAHLRRFAAYWRFGRAGSRPHPRADGLRVGRYEERIPGPNTGGWLLPDFTFTTDAGDTILWEHLGMMNLPQYQADWEWKRAWYAANGFVEGDTLLTTREDNGLLTSEIDSVIDKIVDALSE